MEKYKQLAYITTALFTLSLSGENYANDPKESSRTYENKSYSPVANPVETIILGPFYKMNQFSRKLSDYQSSNNNPEKKSQRNLEGTLERTKKLPSKTYNRTQKRFLFRR
ncbi:MAG: hypothetical protein WC867_03985 [Candidatus Pacearchaeota archaeon]|jgi:cell shape-determining protein MreC